jgi:hypothetical protein
MKQETPITYLQLKSGQAPKLGRNGGEVHYLVLADAGRRELYISIIGNSSAGCWSSECVPLTEIECCLPADRSQAFPARNLASAFTGRSANNPTFLAAVLRAEGLLAAAAIKPTQHQAEADWSDWKDVMLASPGEVYVPPVKAAPNGTGVSVEMTRQEPPADTAPEATRPRRGRKPGHLKLAEESGHARPA